MSDESISEEEPILASTSTTPLPYSWIHMAIGTSACAMLALISLLLILQFNGSRPQDLRPITQQAFDTISGFLITHRIPQTSVMTTELSLEKTRQAHYYAFDMDISVPPQINHEELKTLLEQYLRTQQITVSTASMNNEGLNLRYSGTQFAQVRFTKAYTPATPITKTTTAPPVTTQSTPEVAAPLVTLPVLPDPQPITASTPKEIPPTKSDTPKTAGWTPPSKKAIIPSTNVDEPTAKVTAVQMAKNDTDSIIPPPTPGGAKLAIIVDDGGYGGESTAIILSLSNALTLSILPNTPYGTELAWKADQLGFEIMLHMPMENLSTSLQHEGQLNVNMTEAEIRRLTRDALDQIPQAIGVNNHTGSKFTTDPRGMALFLDTVKQESLYFVDSRTTVDSRALDMAQAYGIPSEKRDIFLDHDNDLDMIRMRFNQIIDLALKKGEAIAICHFRPNTAVVLSELIPELENRGIELVHASQLVQ